MHNRTQRGGLAAGVSSNGRLPTTLGPDISDISVADRVSALALTSDTITPAVETRIRWLINELVVFGQFHEHPFELTAYACALEKEKDCRLLSMIIKLSLEKTEDDGDIHHCTRLFSIMLRETLPTLQDQFTADSKGRPLRGTHLFRRYLLGGWRNYAEKIWEAKEAAVAYSTLTPNDQEAMAASTEAVVRWVNVLDFINSLRGHSVLGESVLHDAITKQLSAAIPTEKEVSKLTALTSPGGDAKTYKMKDRLQQHYLQMQELVKRDDISQISYKRIMRVLQDQAVLAITDGPSAKVVQELNVKPVPKNETQVQAHPLALVKTKSSAEDAKPAATMGQLRSHGHSGVKVAQAEPGFGPHSLDQSKLQVTAATPLSRILEFFTRTADTVVPDYTSELEDAECSNEPAASSAMSDVWRAKLRKGTLVAVKCVRTAISGSDKAVKHTAKELGVWSKLNHTNILQLLGIALFKGKLVMVSEWMEHGSIVQVVNSDPGVDRYSLCVQVVGVVAWLHQEEVVHGDLKGANILVSENGTPKLTDFGLTIMREGMLQFSTTAEGGGTTRWMAPELFADDAARSYKTDVYALGMTLLEIVTGQEPFHEIANGHQITVAIANNKLAPKRPENLSEKSERNEALWKAMRKCWAYDPEKRGSAAEIETLVKSAVEEAGLRKSLRLGSNCCTMA